MGGAPARRRSARALLPHTSAERFYLAALTNPLLASTRFTARRSRRESCDASVLEESCVPSPRTRSRQMRAKRVIHSSPCPGRELRGSRAVRSLMRPIARKRCAIDLVACRQRVDIDGHRRLADLPTREHDDPAETRCIGAAEGGNPSASRKVVTHYFR